MRGPEQTEPLHGVLATTFFLYPLDPEYMS